MASDLQKQLESVRAKALVVSEKYAHLKAAYDKAQLEISELKAKALAREEEIQRLSMQVEYLTVASSVRLSGDDLASAKALIADLVREIDRCLVELND